MAAIQVKTIIGACDIARPRGDAVRTDNAIAIALYERLGFAVEGEHHNSFLVNGQYYDLFSMLTQEKQDPDLAGKQTFACGAEPGYARTTLCTKTPPHDALPDRWLRCPNTRNSVTVIVRPTISNDIPDLQSVLRGTALFPAEMLPDMLDSFLSFADCEDIWITCEDAGKAVGFCYAVPEQLTDGTWNMLAIAVDPMKQGAGYGGAIVQSLEEELRNSGHRLLIADTSGTSAYERTRAFYRKYGFVEEARLRDFWAAGDDKVTFWKAI